MHIAYISAEYPHKDLPASGGIGSFVKAMADSMSANGHRVTLFLCLQTKNVVWTDGKIKIISIKRSNAPKIGAILDRIRIANTVKKYANKTNIDIIEAPDWEGLHSFMRLDIPIVTRIHGSVSYFNSLQDVKIPKSLFWFEKRALQLSSSVVAVSDFSGRLTNRTFNIDVAYSVIYNGVNLENFRPYNYRGNLHTLLYFGTLVRKKGVLELAHIFSELLKLRQDVSLVLIGKDSYDGLEKESTWELFKQRLTDEELKKVDYEGVVPYDTISEKISQATLCVFPSHAEAFPLSWLEAMASGKAIVVASSGWANEMIEDSVSGALADPYDFKLFAGKINELLGDENRLASMGSSARKRVMTRFNQEDLVKKNIRFYDSIVRC